MKRTLWLVVVALLTVDVVMLLQRRRLENSFRDLRRKSASAMVKMEYAAEEEALLTSTRVVPLSLPRVRGNKAGSETVQFLLLASVDDCTNSIEDEVSKLNQVAAQSSGRIGGVQGFFVNEDRAETARRFIKNLSPAPVFPVSVRNALSSLPAATTPLVLVIRTRDGRILDAHKPIPEDLKKRDAFYARWTAALGLS